jgi:uncharacterized protein YecT (DUF1311 family)
LFIENFIAKAIADTGGALRISKAAMLFFTFLYCMPAWALDCSNPITQTDINFCAKAEFENTDKQLIEFIALISSRTDKLNAKRLRAVDTAWVKYRDSQCEAEMAKFEGGSVAPLAKYNCLTLMTKQRIDLLRSLYSEE